MEGEVRVHCVEGEVVRVHCVEGEVRVHCVEGEVVRVHCVEGEVVRAHCV